MDTWQRKLDVIVDALVISVCVNFLVFRALETAHPSPPPTWPNLRAAVEACARIVAHESPTEFIADYCSAVTTVSWVEENKWRYRQKLENKDEETVRAYVNNLLR